MHVYSSFDSIFYRVGWGLFGEIGRMGGREREGGGGTEREDERRLTLCEAIDRFRSIAAWVRSNLILWQLWLLQRRHSSRACRWKTSDPIDTLKRSSFCRKGCCSGPLKLRLSLHPCALQWRCEQFCVCLWFAELEVDGLLALDSSCDLDDSMVWRSIFWSERTLPCWRSLEVCQWPGELEMQRTK